MRIHTGSKSTLFLIEQLAAILVFAVCASVCASFFAASFHRTSDSKATRQALQIAESMAECYKATGGNAEKAAAALNCSYTAEHNEITVYYDNAWRNCRKDEASYVLRLAARDTTFPALQFGALSVEKISGEALIAFMIAARRAAE